MNESEEKLIKDLDDKRMEFQTREKTIENLKDKISFYESFIPKFFSANGEAEGIRMMYEKVEGFDGGKLTCVDLSHSGCVYKEYLEGMQSFIYEIASSSTDITEEVLESFKEKMQVAKNNDSVFIESLFNGTPDINPMEEMVLTEAVQNVEYLIDFIPQMKTIKESCEKSSGLLGFIPAEESVRHTLVDEGLKMMYESVANYCSGMVKAVLTDYININTILNPVVTPERNYELF